MCGGVGARLQIAAGLSDVHRARAHAMHAKQPIYIIYRAQGIKMQMCKWHVWHWLGRRVRCVFVSAW